MLAHIYPFLIWYIPFSFPLSLYNSPVSLQDASANWLDVRQLKKMFSELIHIYGEQDGFLLLVAQYEILNNSPMSRRCMKGFVC